MSEAINATIDTQTQQPLQATAVPLPTGRQSDLKVTALEFTPPPQRSAEAQSSHVENDFSSLNLGEDEHYAEGGYGYGHEGNSWGAPGAGYSENYESNTGSMWAPAQAASLTGPETEAAAIAVLSQQFPEYSSAALSSLFSQCGRSMQSTMQMLFCMEAELSGQNYRAPKPVANPPPPEANFTNDDFPTLGGGSASSKPAVVGTVTSIPFGANYAGKAKAAAALPAPVATTEEPAWTMGGGSGGGNNLGSSSKAAPVWQSSGVERFATGMAVAAEYADRRSDARDHARLRNQCFQNATQAYMAGNKALAKELGAKGRWHNEQMKAAHASAAEDTFSQRNANALNAAGGTPTIDLHGLHVTEALQHLESALDRLTRQGVRSVRVVVGVGQHGKVPARLPAAIRKCLSEWRLPFREPYAGFLEVTLR